MKTHQTELSIRRMCQVLGVSTSGCYAWLNRTPCSKAVQNERLTDQICTIHQAARGTYGASRIHAELLDQGVRVGYHRVAKLMRLDGLQGDSRCCNS